VIVASGLVVSAAGFALLAQVSAQSGVAWVVASQIVLAAGIGAVVTIATDLVLATVPSDSAGAAAAVSETANEFGGAAGIALLGSLGALVYRLGLPPEVPAAAQETLGSAFEVAARLPGELGSSLISAASQSFVNGMQWVAWIGAIGTVLIAAFVLVVLRHIAPPEDVNTSGRVPDDQFRRQDQ
jgi:DHA2 family multidrug resistance protein-like MFS transporter